MKFDIKFDLSQIPSTLDLGHVGLAATVFVLLVLLVVLLTVVVIGLVRKDRSYVVMEDTMPEFEEQEFEEQDALISDEQHEQEETAPSVADQHGPKAAALKEVRPDAALQLLGILQKEARFVDFISEDITGYSDAEIGAAARVVHEGCQKVLHTHFSLEPVRNEEENARVKVPAGFDASEIRLTGNIVGEAPFTGTLVHRGWRATQVKLPKLAEAHDVNIVASAEVEL